MTDAIEPPIGEGVVAPPVQEDLPGLAGEYGKWAATANMSLALNTLYQALNAGPGAPRIAVFEGPSGYGKTVAAAHAASTLDAVYILARSVWNPKSFLEALARELGIVKIGKTAAALVDQIIAELNRDLRPIIIDETDHIVTKKYVEIIRDIYESTHVPILLVGEETLSARLKEWERFDNRLIAIRRAEKATIGDGRLLRNLYARHAYIADDLVDHFTEKCRGITRRIVVNLHNAQFVAIDELDVTSINLKQWGQRPVMTGDVPIRRR